MNIFVDIPFEIDYTILLSKLHLSNEGDDAKEVKQLLAIVEPIIKPKVIYKTAYIEKKNRDSVQIEGVVFSSRVLRVNLEHTEKVFPYIATCGNELDSLSLARDDFMVQFYLDTIKGMALDASVEFLRSHLKSTYRLSQVGSMNPGEASADVWSIEQQQELFSLFGNKEKSIGVQLTDSCLMIPNKSLSGIFFSTKNSYESCQVCPRENCRERRARFDPRLIQQYKNSGA